MDNATGFDPPDDCAVAIFEIYGEALSNIARHSGASRGGIAGTTVTASLPIVQAS